MTRRLSLVLALVCGVFVGNARPALAQQTINVSLGYFTPHTEDARVTGDVLNANENFLDFKVKDFNGVSIGGEWLSPVGNFIEAGAGLSFTRKTVPTVYTSLVNANGSEIQQDLKLRTMPIDVTFRVLPLGQHNAFQPYIGGGLAIVNWRYAETGQWVDTTDNSIFNASYTQSGTTTGPVALGGIRFASSSFATGFEVRYRKAQGDLTSDFAGPKIDLGGWSYLFTVGGRFGQ